MAGGFSGRKVNRRHDPDIVECTDCEREFDLARQYYYGPRCPSCREDS